jgi:hypothetical protein
MFALLIPLGLMLLVGFRIILLILNDGKLPWWLKFIYKKAKATVRNTQSWLRRGGMFCHSKLKFRMNFVPFFAFRSRVWAEGTARNPAHRYAKTSARDKSRRRKSYIVTATADD